MTTQNQDTLLLSQRRVRLYTSLQQIGVDFIEVGDEEETSSVWPLTVYFVAAHPDSTPIDVAKKYDVLDNITASNILIRDAAGIPSQELIVKSIHTLPLQTASSETPGRQTVQGGFAPTLALKVGVADPVAFKQSGRYSETYTLEFVNVPNLDRFFDRASFSLKQAPSEIDPKLITSSKTPAQPIAEIDYLSKDYSSFRKLMLDQLSLLVPQWQERHAADLGIMLVEVMAYAADYLSYYQDAVATEAYLSTARRLISLRRHARLLDYEVHDGCDARTWVHFEINSATEVHLDKGTQLLTKIPTLKTVIPIESLNIALALNPTVFETVSQAELFAEHNQMNIYTWGASEYRLEKGATTAALAGQFQHLKEGDVLIFQETIGGDNVSERHRCQPVRLSENPNLTTDPLFDNTPVTEIRWYTEDALPFPLLVNSNGSTGQSGAFTVVLGNNVLADHGRTVGLAAPETTFEAEELPVVPPTGRYYPKLQFSGLTFGVPFNESKAEMHSAKSALKQDPAEAMPAVKLYEVSDESQDTDQAAADFKDEISWQARRDLLSSGPFARDFVVETEQEGTIYLRFGDGVYGARPVPGTLFQATYRIGNGQVGNVGPETIKHIVSDEELFTSVSNPLAATGGTDPETLDQIRLNAPEAFRGQLKRCVTESDYVTVAESYKDVQNAMARIYWTGSWPTVFIYVQRKGGRTITDDYRRELLDYMDDYRLIGSDIEISSPHYVPLDIVLTVDVDAHHSKNVVRSELYEVFSNVMLPGGESGFFYPGNFTFGQPVYLSQIIAAAMNVPGVIRVEADKFRRLDREYLGGDGLVAGQINIETLEIARLDNDPQAPENGIINFNMRGRL
jgi:hypothetical protein